MGYIVRYAELWPGEIRGSHTDLGRSTEGGLVIAKNLLELHGCHILLKHEDYPRQRETEE